MINSKASVGHWSEIRRSANKGSLLSIWSVLAAASMAQAQVGGEGHVVFASGAYSNQFASGPELEVTAGGQLLLAGRFGVGAEVGLAGFGARTSLDGVVHFPLEGSQKLVPFVMAGYTRSTAEGKVYHGWNAGGGVNYWIRPRVGLRVEFVHMTQHLHAWTEQYHFARFGVTFR